MNKRILKLISTVSVVSALLVGCGQSEKAGNNVEQTSNQMQYVEKEDLKEAIESKSNEYVILDVRKAEDNEKSHIAGSFGADQHAANKEGDDATGTKNLKETLKEATGSETGTQDAKYALVCYSGKSYAQKATDLMIEMGISKDQIYTLKGGMEDWEKGGDEYKSLLE